MGVTIDSFSESDRPRWEELFRGYTEFYERSWTPEQYEWAWGRLLGDRDFHGLAGRLDGQLVGLVHFLVHPSTSSADVCYLQDLFTAPHARGRGVAGALIAAVRDWAAERGCARVYWMTREDNARARRLYDQVAVHRGFIRYELDL